MGRVSEVKKNERLIVQISFENENLTKKRKTPVKITVVLSPSVCVCIAVDTFLQARIHVLEVPRDPETGRELMGTEVVYDPFWKWDGSRPQERPGGYMGFPDGCAQGTDGTEPDLVSQGRQKWEKDANGNRLPKMKWKLERGERLHLSRLLSDRAWQRKFPDEALPAQRDVYLHRVNKQHYHVFQRKREGVARMALAPEPAAAARAASSELAAAVVVDREAALESSIADFTQKLQALDALLAQQRAKAETYKVRGKRYMRVKRKNSSSGPSSQAPADAQNYRYQGLNRSLKVILIIRKS